MRLSVTLSSLFRIARVAVSLACSCASSVALAQTPPRPAPTTPPPPYSPALEAEMRARFEREARAAREAELAAAREQSRRREEQWIDSGREREPDPVPVRYPIVETRVAALGGGLDIGKAKLGWFGGALFTRVFPFGPALGFELGGGISSVGLEAPRYRWAHVEPAVVTCLEGNSVRACARGAIEVGVPFDGGARAPDVLIALKPGLEIQTFTAKMFDGGYASFGFHFNLVVGGVAGAADAKENGAGLGGELGASVAVAF